MRIIPTALLAGVGSLALIGAAFAHTPTPTHHVSIRLPNGAVEEIEYSGNIAPHISFRQAPAIQTAYPSPFAMFGPNSPFAAMERISAEMNREAAQLMQQVNAIAAAPLPGPGRLMLNLEKKGEYCVVLEPAEGFAVAADRGFVERAEALLGRGMVQALD